MLGELNRFIYVTENYMENNIFNITIDTVDYSVNRNLLSTTNDVKTFGYTVEIDGHLYVLKSTHITKDFDELHQLHGINAEAELHDILMAEISREIKSIISRNK
jgi:hypothetical protein